MRCIKSFLVKHPEYIPLFKHTSIGIEREGHRIDPDGNLAKTGHPKTLDGSSHNHYIQRDFADTQIELVSPPAYDEGEVSGWLSAIHAVARRSFEHGEALWPYSMPPALPEDSQIHVAQLDEADVKYREYLVKVYGKKRQMLSGIHYNMQIDPEFIAMGYEREGQNYPNIAAYTSDFYMRLARNFLRHQWILVYLFGATPYADLSFYEADEAPFTYPLRSIRNSRYGYINHPDVQFTFENLNAYVETLEENVREGRLIAEKEFYSNVRLRGAGTARELLDKGIKYLEFRMLDIQPDCNFGLSWREITFMKYFILYLLWRDYQCDMASVHQGIAMKTTVAEEHALSQTVYLDEGLDIIKGMREMAEALSASEELIPILDEMKVRLLDPKQTPAGRMASELGNVDAWLAEGKRLANAWQEMALAEPYQLNGFSDMELSTQILLFDAIQQGLHIDILDRKEQFIRLTYHDHQEYIKKGNITRLDSMVAYPLMENKEVSKRLVQEAGYHTPRSIAFTSLEAVRAAIGQFTDRPIVIKPKSTNMGLGLAVFPKGQNAEVLMAACREAFKYDRMILLEDFAGGDEYRFFVLKGQTEAILKRESAHVIGDGKHTISELVAEKNQHPWRGHNHRRPLEVIKTGEAERLCLLDQGYEFSSVPKALKRVNLRENSNISTGGDSLAMRIGSDIHPSYVDIANGIAKALEVQVTGLDILIKDPKQAASKDNYAFIEANFNPMMMMHIYPLKGEGVRLTRKLLRVLFPEHSSL